MINLFERARVLVEQGRYDLAERELLQFLATQPEHASAHALLALALAHQGKDVAAITAVEHAIALSPNAPSVHYTYAEILIQQGKVAKAKTSISEALRLNPENANYYGCLAYIQYKQKKYTESLKTTGRGLEHDPENVGCMNFRLLNLFQLGRLDLVETEVELALATSPENSFSHTVKGWISLHRNQILEALQSFQEALRLNPQNEWARRGLVSALKARNVFFRMILKFDLWRARLSRTERFGVLALLLIPQVRGLWLCMLLLMGLSRPFFTMLLCLDTYGRLTLTEKEKIQSQWLSSIILSCILGGTVASILHKIDYFFIIIMFIMLPFCILQTKRWLNNKTPENLKNLFLELAARIKFYR